MTRAEHILHQVYEVAPPGFEGTVKRMKSHSEITNPYALAWSMKNKGYQSHKTKSGKDKKNEGRLDLYHPAIQMSNKISKNKKRIK